jgi:hypothetical protein
MHVSLLRRIEMQCEAAFSSTGFSLCGFDFRTRKKTYRLKSVLPKPASLRNLMQGLNVRMRIDIDQAFMRNASQPATGVILPVFERPSSLT